MFLALRLQSCVNYLKKKKKNRIYRADITRVAIIIRPYMGTQLYKGIERAPTLLQKKSFFLTALAFGTHGIFLSVCISCVDNNYTR